MLTAASSWRECTGCFCLASPFNLAFTWATEITLHLNNCPVKCTRNVASSESRRSSISAYPFRRIAARSLRIDARVRQNGNANPGKLRCGKPRSGSGRIIAISDRWSLFAKAAHRANCDFGMRFPKAGHGNDRAWKAKKPAFHPSPHSLEIPSGLPHSHGLDD